MALKRKPRVGEVLVCDRGKRWVVVSFDTSSPRLCWIRPEAGGKADPFIWRFTEGLNSWFSHERGEEPERIWDHEIIPRFRELMKEAEEEEQG